MNKILIVGLQVIALAGVTTVSYAGFFAPRVGQPGTTAVPANDPAIDAWASGQQDYQPGLEVDAQFQTPGKAVGVPGNSNGLNEGTTFDIVALGRGGSIVLSFNRPIYDGPGYDFAVFENSFNDYFLEFAKVEVSSDGINFVGFPGFSLIPSAVPSFGFLDPTNVEQLAGKYRAGYGTPFDLAQLAGNPLLDINDIRYVRLVDVIGDGSAVNDLTAPALAQAWGVQVSDLSQTVIDAINAAPAVIYDPYPTIGSAGFDLDAVGALHAGAIPAEINIKPFDAANEIDPASTGNITVAVYTTSLADGDSVDFDAADIDTASLRLGPGLATATEGPYGLDFDSDGDYDAGFVFAIQDTGITCDDIDLTLTGLTDANEPIASIDFVTPIECSGGGCH